MRQLHSTLQLVERQLLLSIAIAYTLGTATPFFLSIDTPIKHILFGFSCILLLALYFIKTTRRRSLTCLLLFFIIGVLSTIHALAPPTQSLHLANKIQKKTKVTLVGTITKMIEYDGEKSRLTLSVKECLIHSEDFSDEKTFTPTIGKVRLSVRGDITGQHKPGMQIMAICSISPIHNNQTPGSFNYRLHMKAKRIYLSGWIKHPRDILRIHQLNTPLFSKIKYLPESYRQKITVFLNNNFTGNTGGLYQALLTGYRGNISQELQDKFKKSGCFHLLAISGLHLSLLGGISVFIITLIGKRSERLLLSTHLPSLALFATLPLLVLYSFIAGMNTPVFRAILMTSLLVYAIVTGRQKYLLNIVAASALVILIISPLAIATASFQLSFAAVLSITLIFPKLEKIFLSYTSATKKIFKILAAMLAVSLAASVGTLPVLLFHFNRFSLIGPVMNLFIEPLLCFWALPLALLSIPFMTISPDTAIILLKAGQPALLLAQKLISTGASLPLASINGVVPYIFEITLFYMVLYLLFTYQQREVMLFSVAITVILFSSYTKEIWLPKNDSIAQIHYLDVGQGSATFLKLPGGKKILIDGGGPQSKNYNVGKSIIGPFLRKMRIWNIDAINISHPDADHYNGISYLIQQFSPEKLYINGEDNQNHSYEDILTLAKKRGSSILIPIAGEIIFNSKLYTLTCLGMEGLLKEEKTWSSNNRSLVFQLKLYGFSFLFAGDIEKNAERVLLEHNTNLKTDVLLAPHHGSLTSSSANFIKNTDPKIILVSSGYSRAKTHPHPLHKRKWQELNIPYLSTSRCGTISSRVDDQSLKITNYSDKCPSFKFQ